MEDVQRILVASRMTRHCRKAVHYGVSLSQKLNAELYVVHVIHNPFSYEGWNLPVYSLEKEYRQLREKEKNNLDAIVNSEKAEGMHVEELIREGEPAKVIRKIVDEKQIDLVITMAYEEGRLEHFLFGRDIEELVRKMPCSVFLVKRGD